MFQDILLSHWQWGILIVAAMLTGFSKTALSGVMLLVVPILASIFGGKISTGILLPMLIIGDLFAVKYYNAHADWGKISKLMPFTVLGVFAGVFVGNFINDQQFSLLISIIVMACVAILVFFEVKGEKIKIPNNLSVSLIAGVTCGFTSMIGNAAGPIMSIYLLAMGYKKNDFMGTSAWFFLILNLIKVPFQIFVWHNLTFQTFKFALVLSIPIAVGAIIGIIILKKINEVLFKNIVMLMTALAAIKLMIF